MTLSILLSDRIAQLTSEEDAITREIAGLTDRRENIRMVLVEFNQILDRAPLAAVPGVATDIMERFERLQLHPLKPPRARKGAVEDAVLAVLRANDARWSVADLSNSTGHKERSVWAALDRLVRLGEVLKSGRPFNYRYRANPHEKVVPLLKPAS